METNQKNSINRDLIKSSGEKLKWIGYLIFVNILISGLFYYKIVSYDNEKMNRMSYEESISISNEINNIYVFWGLISFISLVFIGILFIGSGKNLMDSILNKFVEIKIEGDEKFHELWKNKN